MNSEEQSLASRYTPITQWDHEMCNCFSSVSFLGLEESVMAAREVEAMELLIFFWANRFCPSTLSHCRKDQKRSC